MGLLRNRRERKDKSPITQVERAERNLRFAAITLNALVGPETTAQKLHTLGNLFETPGAFHYTALVQWKKTQWPDDYADMEDDEMPQFREDK